MPGVINFRARSGRQRHQAGVMNQLETAYAAHLETRKRLGDILDYKFEALKLRLADKCFLTVDFWVMLADGTLEAHETKGFLEGDAWIKLKWAAKEYWWFRFLLVKKLAKKHGGGFSVEEISP
jgi:hypothetical protein